MNPHEKAMQRALIQYRNPKNYDLVEEALTIAGRRDLIGYEKKCLIRPRNSGNGYWGGKDAKGQGRAKAGGTSKSGAGQRSGGSNVSRTNSSREKDGRSGKTKKTIRNIHKKSANK